MTTAAILAGGRARRLGGFEKGLLPLGGRSFVARQIEVLGGLADRIAIVAGDSDRYGGFGVPVLADVAPGAGSLGGILTALSVADDWVLVLACDMPFVTTPFLGRLVDAAREADVALPRSADGPHPLCACYARTATDPIRRRVEAGLLRVQDALADLRVAEIGGRTLAAFDPDGVLLLNVNTPDDYARALAYHHRTGR